MCAPSDLGQPRSSWCRRWCAQLYSLFVESSLIASGDALSSCQGAHDACSQPRRFDQMPTIMSISHPFAARSALTQCVGLGLLASARGTGRVVLGLLLVRVGCAHDATRPARGVCSAVAPPRAAAIAVQIPCALQPRLQSACRADDFAALARRSAAGGLSST